MNGTEGSIYLSSSSLRTVTAKPEIKYNEIKLESSGGADVVAPNDVNAGPSTAQNDRWTNIVDPDSIFYKFEAQFIPSLPGYQPYVKDAKLGIVGGYVKMTSKNNGEITKKTWCFGIGILCEI